MKRIFIILAVVLFALNAEDSFAQTKVFKEYMEHWIFYSDDLKKKGRWEVTQFSGDVLRRLMPKEASNSESVIYKISNIFQITMDDNHKTQLKRAEALFITESKYTNILSITQNGTTYKIYKAQLNRQQVEYAILINNDKDYCICDIVGYLNDNQILSFIGVKNNGKAITGDKKDSVEVIQP
jgi:hypothetical protein